MAAEGERLRTIRPGPTSVSWSCVGVGDGRSKADLPFFHVNQMAASDRKD